MWEQLIGSLDDTSRQDLLDQMRVRRFQKNDVLFHEGEQGDALHVIESGNVLVERVTEQGDSVAVAVSQAGDLVGEQALLGEEQRGATARAVTAVVTKTLNKAAFDELRAKHRQLDHLLVTMLDLRSREMYDLLLEARHHPADLRVRRTLADLAAQFGNEVPLTQETLASLAGTTRPTTNGALRELEEAGVIELKRGRIVIHDQAQINP